MGTYLMKKLIALLALVSTSVFAGPLDVTLQQRNALDNGNLTRTLASPATDGLFYFDAATKLPGYVTLGNGLTITNGVISAAALPSLSTVAYTGQAGDITGLAPVALSGSYNDLTNKPTIQAPVKFDYGDPVTRALSANTVYQATDPTKASVLTVTTACTASLSLTAGGTCSMQIRTSPTAGLTCSTGTVYGTVTNVNTGTLTIGLGLNQRVGSITTINLRSGSYFTLCPTAGTFDISVVDQTAG